MAKSLETEGIKKISFYPQTEHSFLEWTIIRLLRQGKIPTHIGFIMDGNRRYARQRKAETVVGHTRGFAKIPQVLGWCRDMGVRQVTIYAFSIENFKRTPKEVACLMNIFRVEFNYMWEIIDKFDASNICVRIFGKLSLIPTDMQDTFAKIMARTAKNDSFVLNVAIAYTAREEICTAMSNIKKQVNCGQLQVEDISEKTLSNSMYSVGLENPGILARTSGEVRFSDFLLWQTGFSYFFITKSLWPDFSIWDLFKGILQYQEKSGEITQIRNDYEVEMKVLHQQKQEKNRLKKKVSFSMANGYCADLNFKLAINDSTAEVCSHR